LKEKKDMYFLKEEINNIIAWRNEN